MLNISCKYILLFISLILLIIYVISESNSLYGRQTNKLGNIDSTLFGMHIHFFTKGTSWPNVKFYSWRLWDASVSWPYIEPKKNKWNYELLDKYVETAEEKKIEVLLVLGQSPQWASARPNEYTSVGKGFAAEPRSIDDWRSYITNIGQRYKGRIKQYEIWNEPNLKQFYTGSVDEMIRLVKEANIILKSIDSSNVIISPSINVDESSILWLDNYFAKGGGKYIDVLGLHLYTFPHPPEMMITLINKVRKILDKYGFKNLPIWNTEMGWAKPKNIDVETSISYVARTYILSALYGIKKVYWYAWENDSWVTLSMIKKDDGSLKPAALAYQEVQKWLIGQKIVSYEVDNDSTWTCKLSNNNFDTTVITWNASGKNIFIKSEKLLYSKSKYILDSIKTINSTKKLVVNKKPLLLYN